MGASTDEFPLLEALGLYVAATDGNGNCLFNALSDQIYGAQTSHAEIRASVIEHIRENAERYKMFINVHPGGGVRRNPKRKNAGAFSTPVDYSTPTPEEINRVFESHLEQMAKGGTYGDNMEIQAFSEKFGVDVKIWQRDLAYVISGRQEAEVVNRPIAHIAYHTYEHYSSIRNITGPHTGLPEVHPLPLSAHAQKESMEKLSKSSYVLPWMVDVVMKSLPYTTDEAAVHKTLEECKGNLDDAFSKLLDAEERRRSMSSSAQGSSSVERDHDSDDEEYCGPKKKQDRRLSRATQTAMKTKNDRRKQTIKFHVKNEDELSVANGHLSALQHADISDLKVNYANMGNSENDDWQDDPSYKDSDSASMSASDRPVPIQPSSGGTRLKLSQPKRDHEKVALAEQHLNDISSMSNGNTGRTGKTQQRQLGPKQKRLARREKKNAKKAVKERKQGEAGSNAFTKTAALAITSKNGKENSPAIESGIKTLYI